MEKNIKDQDFEFLVLNSTQPVLVDFWAPWCGPCQVLTPIIDKISKEYEGKFVVVKINVDDNPKISSKYDIRSVPTLIFFKDGQPIVRKIGSLSEAGIIQELKNLI